MITNDYTPSTGESETARPPDVADQVVLPNEWTPGPQKISVSKYKLEVIEKDIQQYYLD